jgi:hypothetical protein
MRLKHENELEMSQNVQACDWVSVILVRNKSWIAFAEGFMLSIMQAGHMIIGEDSDLLYLFDMICSQ